MELLQLQRLLLHLHLQLDDACRDDMTWDEMKRDEKREDNIIYYNIM